MAKTMTLRAKQNKRKIRADVFTYIALILIVVFVNIPFIQMVLTAFKTRTEALTSRAILPETWSIESFVTVLTRSNFGQNLWNSFKVSIIVTLMCILIAIMAGYAISRFRSRIFSAYTTFMLVLQLFPGVLMLIPLFITFKTLKLNDTHWALILAYTAGQLPFSIWLLKGFFDSIPFDIEQAGMIDGCSQFGAFWRLVLPISMPGVSTVAIFTFINAWGEYTQASVFIRTESLQTMSIGLQTFRQQFTTDWPSMMAASTLCTLPTLVFLLAAQKYLIRGMSAGSVKG